jgi:hypothetical protein
VSPSPPTQPVGLCRGRQRGRCLGAHAGGGQAVRGDRVSFHRPCGGTLLNPHFSDFFAWAPLWRPRLCPCRRLACHQPGAALRGASTGRRLTSVGAEGDAHRLVGGCCSRRPPHPHLPPRVGGTVHLRAGVGAGRGRLAVAPRPACRPRGRKRGRCLGGRAGVGEAGGEVRGCVGVSEGTSRIIGRVLLLPLKVFFSPASARAPLWRPRLRPTVVCFVTVHRGLPSQEPPPAANCTSAGAGRRGPPSGWGAPAPVPRSALTTARRWDRPHAGGCGCGGGRCAVAPQPACGFRWRVKAGAAPGCPRGVGDAQGGVSLAFNRSCWRLLVNSPVVVHLLPAWAPLWHPCLRRTSSPADLSSRSCLGKSLHWPPTLVKWARRRGSPSGWGAPRTRLGSALTPARRWDRPPAGGGRCGEGPSRRRPPPSLWATVEGASGGGAWVPTQEQEKATGQSEQHFKTPVERPLVLPRSPVCTQPLLHGYPFCVPPSSSAWLSPRSCLTRGASSGCQL